MTCLYAIFGLIYLQKSIFWKAHLYLPYWKFSSWAKKVKGFLNLKLGFIVGFLRSIFFVSFWRPFWGDWFRPFLGFGETDSGSLKFAQKRKVDFNDRLWNPTHKFETTTPKYLLNIEKNFFWTTSSRGKGVGDNDFIGVEGEGRVISPSSLPTLHKRASSPDLSMTGFWKSQSRKHLLDNFLGSIFW